MQLVIYVDERVEVNEVEDGFRRVRIWRNEIPRLTIDTRSTTITFVQGDSE